MEPFLEPVKESTSRDPGLNESFIDKLFLQTSHIKQPFDDLQPTELNEPNIFLMMVYYQEGSCYFVSVDFLFTTVMDKTRAMKR